MIVRISGEGQLEVPDRVVAELNQLNAALDSTVADNDEQAFDKVLAYLLGRVRAFGTPVPDHVVVPSQAMLPSPDSTSAEVRQMGSADGLIPG